MEHQGEHESEWAAMVSMAGKIGCTAETLRRWVRQAEKDTGQREGLTARRSARDQRDAVVMEQIQRVWDEHFQVYGVRKVWRQRRREGLVVARCTVARLMRQMGLKGVVRGQAVKTTRRDLATACPDDLVNRQFRAPRPNALWVSDFTSVSTWQGVVYVAFVIDVFARCIVGWNVSNSMRTEFVLEALEQALAARRPARQGALIHHSDRGGAVRLDPLYRAPG